MAKEQRAGEIEASETLSRATPAFPETKDEEKMALTRQNHLEITANGVGDKVEREERSGPQAPGEERNVLAPPRRRPWFGFDTSTLVPEHGSDGTSGMGSQEVIASAG